MVEVVSPKNILNKHKKRDPWFLDDYSLNPYYLCDFNCIYCYIRGSRYRVKTRNKLAVKINAPTLLEKELSKRSVRREYGFIALSSATEPWMHLEKKYQLTRRCLMIILKYKFPVHCLTKSTLILRDLDILEKIDENAILPEDLRKLKRGVLVTFSLSTLDDKIAEVFEPNAPRPRERLKTLAKIKEKGFKAGIAFIPVLPFISDDEEQLKYMIKIAKEARADYVFVGSLTLYGETKRLYYRVIENYFPELLPKYRQLFGKYEKPNRTYQLRLERRARNLCKKYNMKYKIL